LGCYTDDEAAVVALTDVTHNLPRVYSLRGFSKESGSLPVQLFVLKGTSLLLPYQNYLENVEKLLTGVLY